MTEDTNSAITMVQAILDDTASLQAGPSGVGSGLTVNPVSYHCVKFFKGQAINFGMPLIMSIFCSKIFQL